MVVEPPLTPDTTPSALMVATDGADELHTPPPARSTRDMLAPAHTLVGPVIVPADAEVLEETVYMATPVPQVPETEYEIVTLPVPTPLATPDGLIVTIAGSLLLHVPPVAVLESVDEVPMHTKAEPEMVPAEGGPLTTTVCIDDAEPHPLVTV
jgi:hypothetical protein